MSIIRTSIQETTGDSSDVVQVFYQNIFYDLPSVNVVPFVFNSPVYTTNGGSTDYYGQNPLNIFTNLVKPFIRFDFSANTSSFGPTTLVKHDVYRISWDTFQASQEKYKVDSEDSTVKENTITETIEETDELGQTKVRTIRKRITDSQNLTKNSKKLAGSQRAVEGGKFDNINQSGAMTQEEMQKSLMRIVQEELLEPVHSITATTTGITTNVYDLQFDQFTKNLGEYKTELFQDRDQYIIDTNFIFNIDVTQGLTDAKRIDENGAIVNDSYKSTYAIETSTEKQTITQGEYTGMEFIGGTYFTYLEVPDKPVFEYPTAEGQLTTFTPEIFWSNGEKADEYMVQVSYNTGDTGFTGTVFTYIVPKSDEFKEESDSKIKTSSSEFSSKKTIRKYELSLKSNSDAIYRVGNVKFIKNIFGVKQSVITFSDNKSITTQTEPIKTYVFVENDSPYTEFIAGLSTPASLEAESPLGEYVLSGTVSGSTVSGATMQLVYPNSSFVTTPTNTSGYFEFSSLEAGTYTLNTSYRGYQSDSRTIVITGNTDVFVEIQIKWDNTYDIWAIKENDIIKY